MARSTAKSFRLDGPTWRGPEVRNRGFLVSGIVLIAASLIGPAVQAGVSDSPAAWSRSGHMSDGGHMWGWWDNSGRGESVAPIEGAEELTIVADDFSFSPSNLTVSAGEAMNLRLVNRGKVSHDLVVPELALRLVAAPGEETVAGLDTTAPGVYRFWCTFPGHEAQGMVGELTVETAKND